MSPEGGSRPSVERSPVRQKIQYCACGVEACKVVLASGVEERINVHSFHSAKRSVSSSLSAEGRVA